MDKAKKYLEKQGIRPSIQRMAIMHYLQTHKTHPTADEIYEGILPQVPTLSKMTVYNTIHLLVEQGSILSLDLDGKTLHYDADTSHHAHFLCTICGCIEDVFFASPDTNLQLMQSWLPESCGMIHSAQLSYKGICKHCLEKLDKKN